MEITAPNPKTMPTQLMPMGLSWKEPRVLHRWVKSCDGKLVWMRATMPDHPPASIRPMMEISSAPSQMRTNCSTSLKIAESSPPRPTYTATVMEETQMLKLMSQPSTTFKTSAMEYILMPLISTVMKPKEMAEKARAGSP